MHPLTLLKEANSTCTQCELARDDEPPLFGQGNESARLMIVSDSPDFDSCLLGRPFENRPHTLIKRLLTDAGIDPSSCWFTYATKCRSASPPKGKQVDVCSSWLVAEVTNVRPRVVVALGLDAVRGLRLPVKKTVKLKDVAGTSFPLLDQTRAVVWHSASNILQRGQLARETLTLFKELADEIRH